MWGKEGYGHVTHRQGWGNVCMCDRLDWGGASGGGVSLVGSKQVYLTHCVCLLYAVCSLPSALSWTLSWSALAFPPALTLSLKLPLFLHLWLGCFVDDNGVEFPIGQIWSPGDPCELCICQVNENLLYFTSFTCLSGTLCTQLPLPAPPELAITCSLP